MSNILPKRIFVRALWGIHKGLEKYYVNRTKIDDEIELLKHCKYNEPFIAYVFGRDNYNHLEKQAKDIPMMKIKLVSEEPVLWDMEKQQFRHKLEVLRLAMLEFDEIVFLDWDTIPIKPLPEDFWDVLAKKDSIQATMVSYHVRGPSAPNWREVDRDKTCSASWLYIRDKTIPDKIIKIWEDIGGEWSEERSITKYTDEISGGWQGRQYFYDRFEPKYYIWTSARTTKKHSKELIAWKDVIFVHLKWKFTSRFLNGIKNGSLQEWMI